jgi:hypothetical protein
MATLDIREEIEEGITEIQFDDSSDRIGGDADILWVSHVDAVSWEDFDNFIKACHEARKLWGPK